MPPAVLLFYLVSQMGSFGKNSFTTLLSCLALSLVNPFPLAFKAKAT
jgi:hypothetical protein